MEHFDEVEFAGGNENAGWNICREKERSGRGHIVSVGEKERARVESTWKVFRLRGNAGRSQALTTTNSRNLTQQQI